ncbi:1-deoxy-D-xylulose-5-phosphate synthase [bacterium]|nr:1-deoxy-D-xylulose-5-phosphate synthase [bacterium]
MRPDSIRNPQEIKEFSLTELNDLAESIRTFLLEEVPKTGGHLASNLGAVELTLALHTVFDSPEDRILFDIGHQGYVHKILTGRGDRFPTLRKRGGLSGFMDPSESIHDPVGGSHAGVALSSAAGILAAHKKSGRSGHVVAVVGDGAMTAGVVWEAFNNLGGTKGPLLVILNDNGMSISPNVGRVQDFLTSLRSLPLYRGVMRRSSRWLDRWEGGRKFRRFLSHLKDSMRTFFFQRSTPFRAFGFRYFGPVDGHDLSALIPLLTRLKRLKDRPILLHAVTTKGKGDPQSEGDPVNRHGLSAHSPPKRPSFSRVFGEALADLANEDERILAITAAMAEGTGLSIFRERHPDRFIDVGISEQHAVAQSAAMALEGLRPVAAIYSTFLQRGYDQVIHDAVLQKAPVVFALDRAGIVGGDGASAQGLYDLAYLRCLPGMAIAAARDAQSLRDLLLTGINQEKGPLALRYPRGTTPPPDGRAPRDIPIGKGEVLRSGEDIAILGIGPLVLDALSAAERLSKKGIEATVADATWIKPLDRLLLRKLVKCGRLLVVEEHAGMGGLGSAVLESLQEMGLLSDLKFQSLNVPDLIVPHGDPASFRQDYGLDEEGIWCAALALVKGKVNE